MASYITYQRSYESDEKTLAHTYISCGWRDDYQTYHSSYSGSHSRCLTSHNRIEEKPYQHTCSTSGVGVKKGFYCYRVGMKRRTCVEAKPSQPKHRSAKHYKRHISRSVTAFVFYTFTQEQRTSQRCYSRRCVHYDTTCKIDNSPLTEYPVGMPCTVRQRTIYKQAE